MKENSISGDQYVSPSFSVTSLSNEGMLCTSGGTNPMEEVSGSWGDPMSINGGM